MAKKKKESRRAKGRRPKPEEIEHLLDTEKLETESNSDNTGLGPWENDRVDEANFDKASNLPHTEVPGFVPTSRELFMLAKHWAREELNDRWCWFVSGYVCSSRSDLHRARRVAQIAQAIGDDMVRKAVDEVWEACSKKVDPRGWDIFLHGDRMQRDAYRDELQETMYEHRMKYSVDDEVQGIMAWEAREQEMIAQEMEPSIEHEEQERMAHEMIEEERTAHEMEESIDSADGGERQA